VYQRPLNSKMFRVCSIALVMKSMRCSGIPSDLSGLPFFMSDALARLHKWCEWLYFSIQW